MRNLDLYLVGIYNKQTTPEPKNNLVQKHMKLVKVVINSFYLYLKVSGL